MLRSKAATGVVFVLAAPVCLVLVAFIRLARPFKTIRFTWLPSRLLGHAVVDPEMHLSRSALCGTPDKKVLDLYFFESTWHSNRYWKKIVERHLPANRFYYYLHRFNQLFPNWEPHYRISYGELHATADPEDLLGRVAPQIRFTAEEDRAGYAFLRKLGILPNQKFVCVQVRDHAHDVGLNPVGLPRDYNAFRNSDIKNYVEAFEFLADQGYWVIRMGKLTTNPIKSGNPRVFDYSHSGQRTEFLDLWLCFNCTFMISTGSGLDALAAIARKPIVCVNLLAYLDTTYFFRNSLIIFKPLYDTKSGQRLSMTEIIRRESETYYKSSDFYWSRGIEWRENTPQEIKDAVEEMHARIEGLWVKSPLDEELQHAAGNLIAGSAQYQTQYNKGFVHRLGAKFLRSL